MSKIGRYEILGELKGGGQGRVYRAYDPRLRNEVAIKVVSSSGGQSPADGDHLREARIAVRLDHPNIVKVLDADEDQGQLFLVMELLQGSSLDRLIGDPVFTLQRRFNVARQVCEGLRYAHSHPDKVIHRDIKPMNIMVLEHDRVKIVDFGIAKPLGRTRRVGEGDEQSRFRGFGTLPYMSPEQISGLAVDHRTDIFSFGVVFYELLAKQLPFNGATESEIARQIRTSEPPPIKIDDLSLQEQARKIVARCLAKTPADRYPDCGELLVDLTQIEGAASTPSVSDTAGSSTVPLKSGAVGRYSLLSLIGSGAMGDVYRARDTSKGTLVAVKVLKPEFAMDAEAIKRFAREGIVRIRHPNVCETYECERHEDVLYIAMEYCEGEDLHKLMAAGPLDHETAVELARQVADGLAAVHKKGIVHRDIKPTNIIVRRDGSVKIVDFSVAKFLELSTLTESGARVGSPAYMSPEQVQSKLVDHRTDVWSLGVVLYEMLAGVRPFTNEALVYSIISEEPSPLPASVPRKVAEIVARALQKNPARRYSNIAEMAADLRRPSRGKTRWVPAMIGTVLVVLAGFALVKLIPPRTVTPALSSVVIVADSDCRLVGKSQGGSFELSANRPDTLRLAPGSYAWEVRPRDYPCFDTTFTVPNTNMQLSRLDMLISSRYAGTPRFSLVANAFEGEALNDKLERNVIINDYSRSLNAFRNFEANLVRGKYRIRVDMPPGSQLASVDVRGQKVTRLEPDVFDFTNLVDGSARITFVYAEVPQ